MSGTTLFDDEFRAKFLRLLAVRRDVRRFRADPLPAGTVERLTELACLAPSVGLSQPWRFVAVETPELRAAVRRNFEASNARALGQYEGERAARYARLKLSGLVEAPCHLAVFADSATGQGHGLGRQSMPETIEYSVVTAIHTLWLAARCEGIGVGWVSILDPDAIKAALDVPEAWRLIAYLCVGYPEQEDEVPELERQNWEKRRDAGGFLMRR